MIENKDNIINEDTDQKKTLKEVFSSVTMGKNSKNILIILIFIVIIFILYLIFSPSSKTPDNKNFGTTDKSISKEDIKKISEQSISVTTMPMNITGEASLVAQSNTENTEAKNLEPLPLKTPEPPAPPPPPTPPAPSRPNIPEIQPPIEAMPVPTPIMEPQAPQIDSILSSKPSKDMEAKMQAGIMVFGSGSGAEGAANTDPSKDTTKSTKQSDNSAYIGFDGGIIDGDTLNVTDASNATATKIPSLNRTILQGKIIDAVLETGINTDLKGSVRAIVSRDVYSEMGKNILVIKGSRLIGAYESSITQGQTRVQIVWDRLITPFGIDIKISSEGVDPLGRSGIKGYIDNKLKERLFNAFLVSYVIPLTTMYATGTGDDKINQSETKNKDGSTTIDKFSTQKAQILSDANSQFTDSATEAVDQASSIKPTITINQGTRINVFVQKDLIFPQQAVSMMNNNNIGNN